MECEICYVYRVNLERVSRQEIIVEIDVLLKINALVWKCGLMGFEVIN